MATNMGSAEIQDRGYIPAQLRTSTSGDDTRGWYRGPMTPLIDPSSPTPSEGIALTYANDQASGSDAALGVFDISYAAAWTLGRTLALADPDYASQDTRGRLETASPAVEPDATNLLGAVPYPFLVPRIAPPESVRLFRVDPAWIDALVPGAQSVGEHTAVDAGTAPSGDDANTPATVSPAAAVLVNSSLVPAWPDLDLVATRGGQVVNELRRYTSAPDVLLILWDDVPDVIIVREPSQGIHFGLDTSADPSGLLDLRSLQIGQDTAPSQPTVTGQPVIRPL